MKHTAAKTKGERARFAIAQSAMRLFAIGGYENTSLQQIADSIDMSQSAVLYHFATKKKVFAGVLELMATLHTEIRQDLSPDPRANAYGRLLNHFEVHHKWAVQTPYHAQILAGLAYFASFDDEFGAMYGSALNESRRVINELVHAGMREGVFEKGTDADEKSEILHDALLGFTVASVSSGQKETKAYLKRKWERTLGKILN